MDKELEGLVFMLVVGLLVCFVKPLRRAADELIFPKDEEP